MNLWREVNESVPMALTAVWAHKLRSSLTALGVLIGVFSIIVVMTVMRGTQAHVEGELRQLGSHTFKIQKWPELHFGGPEGFEKIRRRKIITLEQGFAVQEKATLASHVGIEGHFWAGEARSRYGTTPPNVTLLGETPGSFPARDWEIAEGRALLQADIERSQQVCVLGAGLAEVLYPFGGALGERVVLGASRYTVVGVLKSKEATRGGSQDNFAVVPITTALDEYGRAWNSLSIIVQAREPERFEEAVDQVRGILRIQRKVHPGEEDDFEIFWNDSLLNQFNSFTFAVRAGVAAISSVALLAAGIGIMNIMLVSVTERTREIGIRRAIGAKRRTIMIQFVVEAIVLCEIGGALGIILGLAGGNLAGSFLEVPPVIPVDWVTVAVLICFVVGLSFGSYPALKAARVSPVEALRYE